MQAPPLPANIAQGSLVMTKAGTIAIHTDRHQKHSNRPPNNVLGYPTGSWFWCTTPISPLNFSNMSKGPRSECNKLVKRHVARIVKSRELRLKDLFLDFLEPSGANAFDIRNSDSIVPLEVVGQITDRDDTDGFESRHYWLGQRS